MKNRIIMTVGTSLLSSACWDIAEVDTYEGITKESLKRETEANNRDILENQSTEELKRAFVPSIWESKNPLRDLPAEMATLRLLVDLINSCDTPEERLTTDDELFLLHSDNTDGSTCAKVQESLLKVLLPTVVITRKPIANLDPADKSQLQNALKEVAEQCAAWLQPTEPMKIYLNLTGGYKATSMVIASLATRLGRPATIVYGHESSDLARDGLYTIEIEQTNSPIKIGHVTDNMVVHSIAGIL